MMMKTVAVMNCTVLCVTLGEIQLQSQEIRCLDFPSCFPIFQQQCDDCKQYI